MIDSNGRYVKEDLIKGKGKTKKMKVSSTEELKEEIATQRPRTYLNAGTLS